MTEPELIEGTVAEIRASMGEQEMLPAVVGQVTPPANLFRTDEPAEVVRRATEVADALSQVLRKKELTKRIGAKEHVLVEGWTLCGTMLGVFPVCVWTRKLDEPEGWEARVEARTLAGAVIGAAEAQCTRLENMWSHNPTGRDGRKVPARDDYALRSMAQTRATAKALRQPLGFIVHLAGFEVTPPEEMLPDTTEARQAGPEAYPLPRSWAKVREAVQACDEPEAWPIFEAYVRAASYHLYGRTDSKDLSADERKVMLQKAAGAAAWLHDHIKAEGADFLYFGVNEQQMAWAAMLDGTILETPDYQAPSTEAQQLDEEAERLAREAFAD